MHLAPLPFRNSLYACSVATHYMASVGEGIDPPYGALSELVREVRTKETDVFTASDRVRSWRI